MHSENNYLKIIISWSKYGRILGLKEVLQGCPPKLNESTKGHIDILYVLRHLFTIITTIIIPLKRYCIVHKSYETQAYVSIYWMRVQIRWHACLAIRRMLPKIKELLILNLCLRQICTSSNVCIFISVQTKITWIIGHYKPLVRITIYFLLCCAC